MVIGYYEKVNKIVIYGLDGSKQTQHLSIYGLNNYEGIYTYYNAKDNMLHVIDKSLLKQIKLYHDNELVMTI